ncbi:MAG: Uma2 family endonuclease [Phormidesmis sp.]
MTYTPTKTLTAAEFVAQYGDDPRYELIDGVLRNLEPTGPHEAVSGKVSGYLFSAILNAQKDWIIPKNCLIRPPAAGATILRPDVIVLDREKLQQEPLWQREPIVSSGQSIVSVVEVVSTNWQDDYARKVEEYLFLGISEYWIVDFRGLGGLDFIGKPKQPTITICQLQVSATAEARYQKQQFHLHDPIVSSLFPSLRLTLNDLMP